MILKTTRINASSIQKNPYLLIGLLQNHFVKKKSLSYNFTHTCVNTLWLAKKHAGLPRWHLLCSL